MSHKEAGTVTDAVSPDRASPKKPSIWRCQWIPDYRQLSSVKDLQPNNKKLQFIYDYDYFKSFKRGVVRVYL